MPLTQGQIQEAMGRAGLVYELLEVEKRIEELEARRVGAVNVPEDYLRAELNQFRTRAHEIEELLWGAGAKAGEKTWREEIRELDREQALVAVEMLLRRRPEVTPPEDVDRWTVARIRDWLIEKIGELPEEERTGWTR